MPKGIPNNTGPVAGEAARKITLTLLPADYAALAALAAEQYRTPELQAAYLLARVLRESGRTADAINADAITNPTAARILERARNSTPPRE